MQREIKLLKEEAVEQETEMQKLRDENTEVHPALSWSSSMSRMGCSRSRASP